MHNWATAAQIADMEAVEEVILRSVDRISVQVRDILLMDKIRYRVMVSINFET